MEAYNPRLLCTCDYDVTVATIFFPRKWNSHSEDTSVSSFLKMWHQRFLLSMEGGTEINWTSAGTHQLYGALEWQQLKKITVGLCLRWHKVTLRARNPNCEITCRSRYREGIHELRGGRGLRGVENKKLPNRDWEIRYGNGGWWPVTTRNWTAVGVTVRGRALS